MYGQYRTNDHMNLCRSVLDMPSLEMYGDGLLRAGISIGLQLWAITWDLLCRQITAGLAVGKTRQIFVPLRHLDHEGGSNLGASIRVLISCSRLLWFSRL